MHNIYYLYVLFVILQIAYESLPPSLARFSHLDPNIIIYVGYGMQKQVLFYNMAQKKVRISNMLTIL